LEEEYWGGKVGGYDSCCVDFGWGVGVDYEPHFSTCGALISSKLDSSFFTGFF